MEFIGEFYLSYLTLFLNIINLNKNIMVYILNQTQNKNLNRHRFFSVLFRAVFALNES